MPTAATPRSRSRPPRTTWPAATTSAARRWPETAMAAAAPSSRPSGRTLLIACGALARETLAVLSASGLAHLDLTCISALLHNRPERIPEAVREKIREHRPHYERILVLYGDRSEEHTSELQSLAYLVCRLLLEKKKNKKKPVQT